MNNEATNVLTSAILDILSRFGIPNSSFQELWNIHREKKLAETRDILPPYLTSPIKPKDTKDEQIF